MSATLKHPALICTLVQQIASNHQWKQLDDDFVELVICKNALTAGDYSFHHCDNMRIFYDNPLVGVGIQSLEATRTLKDHQWIHWYFLWQFQIASETGGGGIGPGQRIIEHANGIRVYVIFPLQVINAAIQFTLLCLPYDYVEACLVYKDSVNEKMLAHLIRWHTETENMAPVWLIV